MEKSLKNLEARAYACCIFPIRIVGPFKFWIDAAPTQSISEGKIAGIVSHAEVMKKIKITIPSLGRRKKVIVTPEMVLSRLNRRDFSTVQGYSVKIEKPAGIANKKKDVPDYYDATVTLYQADPKPRKLILRKIDVPREQKKSQKPQKEQEKQQ